MTKEREYNPKTYFMWAWIDYAKSNMETLKAGGLSSHVLDGYMLCVNDLVEYLEDVEQAKEEAI